MTTESEMKFTPSEKFNGLETKETDDFDKIYEQVIMTKSCIQCNFRDDELFKKVWYDLKNNYHSGGYKRFNSWNFEGSTFPEHMDNVGFTDCNLAGTDFEGCGDFHNMGFFNCNLEDANLNGITIDQGLILKCKAKGAFFQNSHFRRSCEIRDSDLSNTSFEKSKFDNVTFSDTKLINGNFYDCKFDVLTLEGEMNFTNINFKKRKYRIFIKKDWV